MSSDRILGMVLIEGLEDYGMWCKKGGYHLITNSLYQMMKKKKLVRKILVFTSDDVRKILHHYKANGVPLQVVEYLKELKDDIADKSVPENNALWKRREKSVRGQENGQGKTNKESTESSDADEKRE